MTITSYRQAKNIMSWATKKNISELEREAKPKALQPFKVDTVL